MPPLILVIFLLQLAIHIINTLGAAAFSELLWILYIKLPTPTSIAVQKAITLKTEVLRLKRDMAAVSPQDDFARWAKLRRQHDKVVAEYDGTAASINASKSSFTSAASILRWLGTNGLRWALQFWFARRPVFWLPRGMMPWGVEWLLCFPRAPLGSVSVQVWWIACATAISAVWEVADMVYVLVTGWNVGRRKQSQAFAADAGGAGDEREKKEL